MKLEVIKVSTEKEVAVKKTYHRIVGCRMVVGIIGCKEWKTLKRKLKSHDFFGLSIDFVLIVDNYFDTVDR